VPKDDDILQLQDEVTREVNGDAQELAKQIFPTRGPDMARVDNATLDRIYRQKYESGDRQWLHQEAQRDPDQFLKVVERIGVSLPQTSTPGEIHPPPDASAIQAPSVLPPGPLPQALDVAQPQVAAQLPLPAVPEMPAPPPPTVPTVPQMV